MLPRGLHCAECAGSTAGSTVSRTSSELAALEADHSGHPVPYPDAGAAARYASGGLALGVLPPVEEAVGETTARPSRPASAPGQASAPVSPAAQGSAAGAAPALPRPASPRLPPLTRPAARPGSPQSGLGSGLPPTPAPTPAKVEELAARAAAEEPLPDGGVGGRVSVDGGTRGVSPTSERGVHEDGESAETGVESLAAGSVAESYGTAGEYAHANEAAPGSHRRDSSDGGSSFLVDEPTLTGAHFMFVWKPESGLRERRAVFGAGGANLAAYIMRFGWTGRLLIGSVAAMSVVAAPRRPSAVPGAGDREFCVRGRLQGDEDKLNLRLRIAQPHGERSCPAQRELGLCIRVGIVYRPFAFA